MFIDAAGKYRGTENLCRFENQDYKIYWHGLIYRKGHPSGLPSITSLAADLKSRSLPQLAQELRGAFMALVDDKRTAVRYILVDNSGMFQVFCSDYGLSTSFLELAAAQGCSATDLDPETLVELLHFGYIGFGRTLVKEIGKLAPEQIACISRAGISYATKILPSFDEPARQSFEELLADFAQSVSAERVSIDLTGGMDTRALVAILHYLGLPFELAVHGTEENTDVQIAIEVAEALGRELHVCDSPVDDVEQQLDRVLAISDGLLDALKSYSALQLQEERAERGITLMLSGNGGELYRDDWWLQDFPFYAQKKAHVERFCNTRLLPKEPNHSILAEPYAEISRGYRNRLLRDLSRYTVPGNTQTYDRQVFHYRVRDLIGRFVTNHVQVLQAYVPFVERDALIFGYHLPRLQRFFDFYFRKTTTKCAPLAARVRTTRGNVTMSDEWPTMAKDLIKYCDDKFTRVKRTLEQKYLHRHYRSRGKLDNAVEPPQLFRIIRSSRAFNNSVTRLKEVGILDSSLPSDAVNDGYLGTVLSAAFVMEQLESTRHQVVRRA